MSEKIAPSEKIATSIEGPEEKQLESWKEIAAYLKRDVRTVIRWEKSEGLPVHRHLHQARSSVYAFPSEINAWSATRQPRREEAARWRRSVPSLAFAAVLMLSLLLVADAPYSTYAAAAQQAPASSGMTSRRLWELPPLVPFVSLAIAPNGQSLTHADGTSGTGRDLVVHDFATGRDRVLSNRTNASDYAEYSAISRDGKQVAYTWYSANANRNELRLASLEGTGLSQSRLLFTNEDGYLEPYDWSPDGLWIAVQLSRKDQTVQMGLISVRDGSLRVLKSAAWSGMGERFFSPDGKYLGFDLHAGETRNDQRDVFILAVDGSREVPAVVGPSDDTMMGWSPDGKHLLFASDRGGAIGLWALPIADGRPQGTPALLKSDISRRSLGVSISGSLYSHVRVGVREIQVATVDFETGKLVSGPVKPVQGVGFNQLPAWSPDGKYLAYYSLRDRVAENPVLGILSVETGQVRELLPRLNYLQAPHWAPDGRSLLVGARDLKNRRGAYQIDAQTGEATALGINESGRNVTSPQLPPGGKRLYYIRGVDTDPSSRLIIEQDLASGKERQIFRGDGLAGLSLSPDGRFIATTYSDRSANSFILLLIPVSGGEPRELLRVSEPQSMGGVSWMPDSRAVLIRKGLNGTGVNARGDQAELWLVPTNGGQPRKIDLGVKDFGVFTMHPDGRQIAFVFVAGQNKEEVWVLENFLPGLQAGR